jgi:nitrogen regulatory protein PII-like uncharacterized protein
MAYVITREHNDDISVLLPAGKLIYSNVSGWYLVKGREPEFWAGTKNIEDVDIAIEKYTDYPLASVLWLSREGAEKMAQALQKEFGCNCRKFKVKAI